MEWLNSSLAPLKDLLGFLYKKSKTNDGYKKQVIIEWRYNLNGFKNVFFNQSLYEMTEILMDKIDEKMVELKNIKK